MIFLCRLFDILQGLCVNLLPLELLGIYVQFCYSIGKFIIVCHEYTTICNFMYSVTL